MVIADHALGVSRVARAFLVYMLSPLPRRSGWAYFFAHSPPAVSAFPDMTVGSACASSFSRLARRSLALRPAHSRCHQFVTRFPKATSNPSAQEEIVGMPTSCENHSSAVSRQCPGQAANSRSRGLSVGSLVMYRASIAPAPAIMRYTIRATNSASSREMKLAAPKFLPVLSAPGFSRVAGSD